MRLAAVPPGASTGCIDGGSRRKGCSGRRARSAKTSGRYDSMHHATACLAMPRNAREGKRFSCGSASACRTISRTWTTISERESPRSWSAATFARTESRSLSMKANSSRSSGATKGAGGPKAGTGKSFMSGLAEEWRRQKRRGAATDQAAECGLVGTSRTISQEASLNLNGWPPIRGFALGFGVADEVRKF
jgi:hypothetical protein